MLVRELNPDERPLARLDTYGAETLSSVDLLSIIFGGQTSLRAARYALRNGLSGLTTSARDSKIAHLRRAKIAALLELSRRLLSEEDPTAKVVFTTDTAARQLIARLRHKDNEHCGVILLDSRNNILGEQDLFIGTRNNSLVSTSDILRTVILAKATAFVMYHNHPSGDPSPSPEDLQMTARIKASARLMDLDFLDHIIVGHTRYYSLYDHGQF